MKNFNKDLLYEDLAKADFDKVISVLLAETKGTIFYKEAINLSSLYEMYKRNLNLGLSLPYQSIFELNTLNEKAHNLIIKIEKYEKVISPLRKHKSLIKTFSISILLISSTAYIYFSILHQGNFMFDKRDYHIYRVIKKNGYEYMVENLNYNTNDSTSWCYENKPENCKKIGKLYTWEGAKRSCAGLGRGWRLPTKQEINDVIGPLPKKINVDGMLGGGRSGSGEYFLINEVGHYWTNDYISKKYIWIAYVYGSKDTIDWFDYGEPNNGFSCRCVRTIK